MTGSFQKGKKGDLWCLINKCIVCFIEKQYSSKSREIFYVCPTYYLNRRCPHYNAKLFKCMIYKYIILKDENEGRIHVNQGTLMAASLQTSHEGTSLVRNQLRRSRKDLTPIPIFPSGVEQSHWSFTSWSRVFSFCDMEKFLKPGGIWTAPPWDCESVAPWTCDYTRNGQKMVLSFEN